MRIALHLGWLAGAAFTLGLVASASLWPEHAPTRYGVGLLGSALHPWPWLMNGVGFGLAGLALAGFACALERSLAPLPRSGRVATGLIVIAGLAFAAQGLFALDPNELDGAQSRCHAVAHAVALLSWSAGLGLLAFALRSRAPWRKLAFLAALGSAAMLSWLLLPTGTMLAPGWSERAQWGAFFAWPAYAALVALRRDSAAIRAS